MVLLQWNPRLTRLFYIPAPNHHLETKEHPLGQRNVTFLPHLLVHLERKVFYIVFPSDQNVKIVLMEYHHVWIHVVIG